MANINIGIIERNITGCATSEEQSVLHSWLELNKANRDAYFRMKNIWDSCRVKGYSHDHIRREWELLVKRIGAVELKPQPSRSILTVRAWMRYAAVFVAAAVLTWMVASLRQSAETTPSRTWQQFVVPNGQRTQVILADGTKVWLNAGTVLKYPSDFGMHSRQTILEGEASFRVAPSDIPFTVTADQVNITALGTCFNVRSYSTDDYVETALFEGSVMMRSPQSELVMKPGEIATYLKRQQTAEVKLVPDIADKMAWNSHQLVMNGERLEDIARTLERWYDVKITITDEELKDLRYTGKFVYNENIRQVIRVISVTTPIQYKIEGNEISVSKAKQTPTKKYRQFDIP